MTTPRQPPAPGQEGSALLMVMGVLATCMVLIAHLMTVSEILSKEAYAISTKGLLRYQAESAADTAFWLHLTDRRLFANRTLGQTEDDDFRTTEDFPPWMLDGRPHLMDNEHCCVTLNSGESGLVLKNMASQLRQGLSAVDDADLLLEVDAFVDAYNDYVDDNDLRSLNGYEEDDYAADGFYTLPRNGPMEFKAELYWLPGWDTVVQGEIATLPPMQIAYSYASTTRTSIFSATSWEIASQLDQDEDSADVQAVMDALRLWREEGIPLEDSLDMELLVALKNHFSFLEAGVAVVEANSYDGQREVMGGYRVVREAKMSSRTFFADNKRECLSIWERKWR
ncbi:MAG: hypothetical protein ACI4SG_06110 [Oligosphaeraceae bacterium]